MAESISAGVVLAACGLVVDYPGVRALDGAAFELCAGEIHGLMGENGAGKSTLIRVLTGLVRASAGHVEVGGREVRAASPREAEAAGISAVFQEVDVVPSMTVADNIGLLRQPKRFGMIRRSAMRARAEAALARLGVRLDVRRLVGELPLAMQQMVAIARALDVDARVLILDEPTSSLGGPETAELFAVMRRLRKDGVGIIFVTHFLEQVYEISDRVTVLRQGERVGTWPTRELARRDLVRAMTGRVISINGGSGGSLTGADAIGGDVLVFEGLARRNAISACSGRVRSGAALGFAGLLGSGRTELARLLAGADRPDHGEVRVGGRRLRPGSVRDAVRHGVAYTPEDRKSQGLIAELSVRENIVLAMQARRGAVRRLPKQEQRKLAEHYIRSLGIRSPSPETPVGALSGGNQQKVLLARWLAMSPKVLILDEPTRGIDVGAKAEIEALIASLRQDGVAIAFISSELREIERTCDRALVLRDRKILGELPRGRLSEPAILAMIADGPAAVPEPDRA